MPRSPASPSRAGRRLPRQAQARSAARRAGQDPDSQRRALLAAERGTLHREASIRVALAYPSPYRVAMSSLGYQVIYRLLNSRPEVAAERVMLPEDLQRWRRRGWAPLSIESGRPLSSFDLIAVSATYDLDLAGFFELLDLAGLEPLRAARGPRHPPVVLGGPLTASNALPFGPFVDLAVIGDGEEAVTALLDAIVDARDRDDLVGRAARIPGVWAPELHGDRVPAVEKVAGPWLPAFAQITTPHTELSNLFLVEPSRGCPRYCKFCLVRAPESPMRETELEAVLAGIPPEAERVGFVGAAISEWRHIREALRRTVEAGRGVGISSLRADCLDAEFVDLLRRGGYRTLTVASDAPSQRQRDRMAKALRERSLIEAARLAAAAGMGRLKLYVILGLPGETDADLDELIGLGRELGRYLPLVLGISPLVPKLHTPLGDAPFAGIEAVDRSIARVRRALAGTAEVRATSGRWAWVEYRMSQGAEDAGLAALAAWRAGGSFAAWRRELLGAEERGALVAARRHGLWAAAGMR